MPNKIIQRSFAVEIVNFIFKNWDLFFGVTFE